MQPTRLQRFICFEETRDAPNELVQTIRWQSTLSDVLRWMLAHAKCCDRILVLGGSWSRRRQRALGRLPVAALTPLRVTKKFHPRASAISKKMSRRRFSRPKLRKSQAKPKNWSTRVCESHTVCEVGRGPLHFIVKHDTSANSVNALSAAVMDGQTFATLLRASTAQFLHFFICFRGQLDCSATIIRSTVFVDRSKHVDNDIWHRALRARGFASAECEGYNGCAVQSQVHNRRVSGPSVASH